MLRCRIRSFPLFLIFLLILLVPFGCTKKAPTSPPFDYAGEWRGTYIDYNFFSPSTGNPIRSYNLVLTVLKDGSATAEGDMEEEFVEGLFVDRLKMWLTVLPDGSVYGSGEWSVRLGNTVLAAGEGRVLGQLDSESGDGSGSLIISEEIDEVEYDWHLPWQVKKQ